jgi:putative Mg2+ transporter-C (MgtC) family protein
MPFTLSMIARLTLAGFLGGVIGYEREHTRRPAGFRTHILVCVGAALVMVTSEFIFKQYHTFVNMDPARLGAQVISGIGFLGAGTIIRDGFTVKGLTTAASLWAVSCVGIAAGIGFYGGAIVTTIIVFLTLISLRKVESNITKSHTYSNVSIRLVNRPGWIEEIGGILEKNNVAVKNMEFNNGENVDVKLTVRFSEQITCTQVMDDLQKMAGIIKVSIK